MNHLKNVVSKFHAEKVMDSQYDLGGKSKLDLFFCLTSIDEQEKKQAYEKLDPLTKLIADICLKNDTEEAINEFSYTIQCLKEAQKAMELIQITKVTLL